MPDLFGDSAVGATPGADERWDLVVVSSDRRFPLDVTALMRRGVVRIARTFYSGAECLRALELEDAGTAGAGGGGGVCRVVLIDGIVSDIAPNNLCDALRRRCATAAVVMVIEERDVASVERAMRAGAAATIARHAGLEELHEVVCRVIERQRGFAGGSAGVGAHALHYGTDGVFVPVVGSRGGAGRSTIAAGLALLAAERGVDVALLDADLQFGDMGFLFGARMHATLLELDRALTSGGVSARSFGLAVDEHLTLYIPQTEPEKEDLLTGRMQPICEALRCEHQLVIANSCSHWTVATGELVEAADLALVVCDRTMIGMRATKSLFGMLRRLGIARAKLVTVMNRADGSQMSTDEARELLSVDELQLVRELTGREKRLLDYAELRELFDRPGQLAADLALLLDEVASRSSLNIAGVGLVRQSMQQTRHLFRRNR
ncbi:MAG: hypothetical protein LBS17_03250 [Actinomycetes bacterium]|jgi:Flp pilus assembly CpaE family ATPase|nr:hypothetical protein [Actinomycetes bacterium]